MERCCTTLNGIESSNRASQRRKRQNSCTACCSQSNRLWTRYRRWIRKRVFCSTKQINMHCTIWKRPPDWSEFLLLFYSCFSFYVLTKLQFCLLSDLYWTLTLRPLPSKNSCNNIMQKSGWNMWWRVRCGHPERQSHRICSNRNRINSSGSRHCSHQRVHEPIERAALLMYFIEFQKWFKNGKKGKIGQTTRARAGSSRNKNLRINWNNQRNLFVNFSQINFNNRFRVRITTCTDSDANQKRGRIWWRRFWFNRWGFDCDDLFPLHRWRQCLAYRLKGKWSITPRTASAKRFHSTGFRKDQLESLAMIHLQLFRIREIILPKQNKLLPNSL